jgi:hypothetical protein
MGIRALGERLEIARELPCVILAARIVDFDPIER